MNLSLRSPAPAPDLSEARTPAGFSLVELLVSMGIFALVVVMIAGMAARTQDVTSRVTGQVYQFKEARSAFEAITQKLSQATLQTYWDYEYATSGGRQIPLRYVPQSELRFVTGQAPELLSEATAPPSHAVFFTAPLGFSNDDEYREFSGLLNAWGYYLEFSDGSRFQPPFVSEFGSTWQPRHRFRLIEYRQPSEELSIYRQPPGSNEWFSNREPLFCRVVAENIIAMVIQPLESRADVERRNQTFGGNATVTSIAPNYSYDSANPSLPPSSRHQLPPLVRVTLVALDEGAAARLEDGATQPVLVEPGWFTNAANYESDLAQLEQSLRDQRLGYRVFSSTVALRAAKWTPRGG